jgi:hypothetical protein
MLIAVISLVSLAVIAIVVVALFAPDDSRVEVIGLIMACVVPSLTALLALLKSASTERAVQDVHVAINSRMGQLLALAAKSAHSEGVIEGVTGVATNPSLPTVQETLSVPQVPPRPAA